MSVKKGLGRGFDSLIPDDLFDDSFDPTADEDQKISQLRELKLADIIADPDQPRRHFDETDLRELAASIEIHGVLQPIVVTKAKNEYMLVAGERRWRAAKLAGLQTIPALVRSVSDQHRLELSLIENLQRRDLNALETATAYAKLRDQFNLSLSQIGTRVGGKSISAVSNTIRLLKLPRIVLEQLGNGQLSEGQARPLIGLELEQIEELLPKIIQGNWTAREIERAMAMAKHAAKGGRPKRYMPAAYREVSQVLTKRFDVPVEITSIKSGKGKIVISFRNQKDFARIRKLLS